MFDPATSASGHRREFEVFYREQFPHTWRTLSRLGVAARDCEDAAQEVFVTAYRRWSSLRDSGRRPAWVAGIARRIASNYRRSSDRRSRKHDAAIQLVEPTSGIDHELMRREAWRALLGFLDALEPAKREAFVLGELEELTRPELAAALGVRPSTAYSRLEVARRLFLAHFAEFGDEGAARVLALAVPEPPSSEQTARSWAGLAPLLVGGLPGASAVVVPSFAKIAVTVVLAGGVGIGAVASRDPPQQRRSASIEAAEVPEPPAAAAARGPIATPPVRLVQPAVDAAVAIPARASERRSGPSSPDPSASGGDDPAEEVALLKGAREAALAGDTALARRRLDDHLRRFGDDSPLAALRREIERGIDGRVVSRPSSGDQIDQEH